MSDKLFENDLTPSACQSDGNFGQSVASSAVFLSLPCHALHYSLVPSSRETPPPKRESSRQGCCSLIIPWCLAPVQCHLSLESQVEGGECASQAGMHCFHLTSCLPHIGSHWWNEAASPWLVFSVSSHLYMLLACLLTVSEQPIKQSSDLLENV